MKLIAIFLGIFLSAASPVLAHGEDMQVDNGMMTQFNEMQPFQHMSEGHWFSALLSIILWLGLIYAVYTLVRSTKKKGVKKYKEESSPLWLGGWFGSWANSGWRRLVRN